MKISHYTNALFVASTMFSLPVFSGVSGSIDVYSKYIYRGVTTVPENDNTTVQAGLDYSADNGLYVGYWGSNLGYGDNGVNGVENDFYAGYSLETEAMSIDMAVYYYYYTNVSDQDAPEISLDVSMGDFTAGLKYLAQDAIWGNKGDIYWSISYNLSLPKEFSLAATAGYYTYKDSGEFIASTVESGAFRNLDLTLSHAIGNTGAEMRMMFIVGGKDRDGIDQDNTVLFGVGYPFEI